MGLNDLIDKSKDNLAIINERIKKQKEEVKIQLNLTSGKNLVTSSLIGSTTLRQQKDGYLYFNNNDNVLYELLEFVWSGPQYSTLTKSETNGTEKGKTKKKGRLVGALAGTLIVPGIGTVLGAAHGTGNKKSKTHLKSNTVTTDEAIEVDTPANIKLRNKQTGEIISIGFDCNNRIATQISTLTTLEDYIQPTTVVDDNIVDDNIIADEKLLVEETDPYEEIKKAKELLDMGILTQEEFDAKKKQLLGL